MNGATLTTGGVTDTGIFYQQTLNAAAGVAGTYKAFVLSIVPTLTTGWSNLFLADYINSGVSKFSIRSDGRIAHTPSTVSGSIGFTSTVSTAASGGVGHSVTMSAGGTSASLYSAGNFDNVVAGTGTTYLTDSGYGMRLAAGNLGVNAFARAAGIGINCGGEYLAKGGNTNIGIWASATITKVSGISTANSVNVGVVGLGVPEATIESGAVTSTAVNKLIEAGQNFTTTMTSIGYKVRNITTGATAIVTAVDSATQLSLSADIMTATGQNYRIINGATFGGWFGLYNQATMPYGNSSALVADNGAASADIFDARDNGVSVFRIMDGGGLVYEYTAPGAYPYPLTTGDRVLVIDTNAARTIDLPSLASVPDGFFVQIKDLTGLAGTNPITIDGSGTELIDGSQTKVINNNFGSVSLQKHSTKWMVI